MKFRGFAGLFLFAFVSACGGSSNTDSSLPVSNLPPDPGIEGIKTLDGIDSDADGLRDDIQLYIEGREFEIAEKRATIQVARSLQESIRVGAGDSTQSTTEAGLDIATAIDCLLKAFGDDANDELQLLNLATFNTDERSDASSKFDQMMSGIEIGDYVPGDNCE